MQTGGLTKAPLFRIRNSRRTRAVSLIERASELRETTRPREAICRAVTERLTILDPEGRVDDELMPELSPDQVRELYRGLQGKPSVVSEVMWTSWSDSR